MPYSLTRVLNIIHLKVVFYSHCFYVWTRQYRVMNIKSVISAFWRDPPLLFTVTAGHCILCVIFLCVCVFNMINLICGTIEWCPWETGGSEYSYCDLRVDWLKTWNEKKTKINMLYFSSYCYLEEMFTLVTKYK